jgi:hypothetical protein
MRSHVVDMDRGIPEIEPPLDYARSLQCRASGCDYFSSSIIASAQAMCPSKPSDFAIAR